MNSNRWLIYGVLLFGGVSTVTASSPQEESSGVGDSVAQNILTYSPLAIPFSSGLESDGKSGSLLFRSNKLHPVWLSTRPISGLTQTQHLLSAVPVTQTFSFSFKDYRYRSLPPVTQSERGSWVERLILKPELHFGNELSSRVYYRMGFDRVYGEFNSQRDDYNSPDSIGVGIVQSWFFNQRQVELGLGYEYEQNSNSIFTYTGSGHKVNVYGSTPLPFGLFGRLEAAFSRNDYLEYAGESGLESERAELTAGLSSRFGQRLTGSLLFKYSNEEFLNNPGTKRSRLWGLNLKYIY